MGRRGLRVLLVASILLASAGLAAVLIWQAEARQLSSAYVCGVGSLVLGTVVMVLHLTLSDEFLDRHLGKEAATSLRRTCRSAWVVVVLGAAMIAVEFFAGPGR